MTRRRIGAAVIVVTLVVGAVIVFAIGTSSSRCAGLQFPTNRQTDITTPPVGGHVRLFDRVRRAFGRSKTSVSYCHDFADPSVLRVGDKYFAYATNSSGDHIPVLYGAGLFDTQHERDALPRLPKWAKAGKTWAPSVAAFPNDYILYYTTTDRRSGKQCLSSAVAAEPTGPFVDSSTAPLLCDAFDAQPVISSDRSSLIWAAGGMIHTAPLGPDHRTLAGPPLTLLHADQPWEDGIVEAPVMLHAAGRYFLFYSGNRWESAAYAINYARCETPLGPCTKAPGPWIAAEGNLAGPGGQDFFEDPNGQRWMVFHAWGRGAVGYPSGARYLFVAPIRFAKGKPTVGP